MNRQLKDSLQFLVNEYFELEIPSLNGLFQQVIIPLNSEC